MCTARVMKPVRSILIDGERVTLHATSATQAAQSATLIGNRRILEVGKPATGGSRACIGTPFVSNGAINSAIVQTSAHDCAKPHVIGREDPCEKLKTSSGEA